MPSHLHHCHAIGCSRQVRPAMSHARSASRGISLRWPSRTVRSEPAAIARSSVRLEIDTRRAARSRESIGGSRSNAVRLTASMARVVGTGWYMAGPCPEPSFPDRAEVKTYPYRERVDAGFGTACKIAITKRETT